MVLSNTVVILHDISLINTPMIIAPMIIHVRSSFFTHLKTVSHPFSGQENISEEEKKRKRPDIITTLPHPNQPAWIFNPDNRMAWRKPSRGVKMWKGSAFSYGVSPSACRVCEKWACSACLCVSCQQWGLAPGAGRSMQEVKGYLGG